MAVDGVNKAAYKDNNYKKSAKPQNSKNNEANENEDDSKTVSEKNSKISGATKRGTRIVKKGNELDKNAFLRILTAELANQDPMNAKDSTQFVSQLAQFSSLEQMANLNSTMALSSAHSLVGKVVALDVYDDMGVQYGGLVKSVTKNGDDIKLKVQVTDNGKSVEKDFDFKSVSDVFNTANPNLANMDYNMNLLMASSFIGKEVKAANDDGVYVGKVKSVYKDKYGVNLSVMVNGKVTSKNMTPEHESTKDKVVVNGVYNGNKDTKLHIKYNRHPESGQTKYQYKFVDDGQKEGQIAWSNLPEDKKIKGIKIITQEKEPIADGKWSVDLAHIEPKIMNFSSNYVYEVSENISNESE